GFSPQHFGPLGVEIAQVQGLSVNLPDEVQKAVSTRSTMGVLGVNYLQYQAGQAMTTAAANPSGGAGAMASAGVGLGAAAAASVPCPKCGQPTAPGAKFCPSCGASLAPVPPRTCPKCNTTFTSSGKFCPNCGAALP